MESIKKILLEIPRSLTPEIKPNFLENPSASY